MSDFFLGEIRLFAYGRAPRGWLPCAGQSLPINQNVALYSLIGTMYGGDGKTTFNLPDLRGHVPLGFSADYPVGKAGGTAAHALTVNEMPQHTHQVSASTTTAGTNSPGNNVFAAAAKTYAAGANAQMSPRALSVAGASQAHQNMQPFLTVSLCISTNGIFPPRP